MKHVKRIINNKRTQAKQTEHTQMKQIKHTAHVLIYVVCLSDVVAASCVRCVMCSYICWGNFITGVHHDLEQNGKVAKAV
jgi:formate hydrogenlyase subunit 6/NADH:ubiquinone oxidoreductase subunit I